MKKSNKIKVGIFALTALSSALTAMEANAAICTNGSTNAATITLNQAVLATMQGDASRRVPAGGTLETPSDSDVPTRPWNAGTNDYGDRFIYLNKFYADSAFSYATGVSNTYPTNYTTVTPDSGTKTLPVVCTTGTPGYQTGNVVSTYNGTSGKLGLAGLFKLRSSFQNPTLSNRFGKLNLRYNNTAGSGWELWEGIYGESFLKLTEVYESKSPAGCVAGTGACTLTLKANLRFANGGAAANATGWGKCYGGFAGGNAVCLSPGGGTGAGWWIGLGLDTSYNILLMGAGTGTITPTSTGVLNTGVSPARYWNGTTLPTGTEAQALVGRIEVTTKY
ncbi:hypothetical protein ACQE3D_04660 [Methylomonas sp. MS20]|uniref:hypothetical protein n=1 Tax=unclassified Methylomonas TaxID=2608980 RepID=UPI0028A45749|nr:hypothetical protein [Methylomonas sp. MV1]MDT4329830.1 hypothetical protein [Methylomonas sp. MV1]